MTSKAIAISAAQRLLQSVVAIGSHHANLFDRRKAFLTVLMREIDADSAFWTWGHGKPTETSITPVAVIDLGFTETQRTVVLQWGFDRAAFRDFYIRIYQEMEGDPNSRSLRLEDFNDDDRLGIPTMRRYMNQGGWGSWLHNVRYGSRAAWSSLFLLRNSGRGEFQESDAAMIELAVDGVHWLHATAEEYSPTETLHRLTQRQRTVALMLLDGMPRKTIASQLGISEDTVGDHIKAIFKHFDVGSATALAALFLKNHGKLDTSPDSGMA